MMKKMMLLCALALLCCFCAEKSDKVEIITENGVEVVLNKLEPYMIKGCFVSAKFRPLMIFLKRWFAYSKTTQGEMHEYQEETNKRYWKSPIIIQNSS